MKAQQMELALTSRQQTVEGAARVYWLPLSA
jgi:hypothetical protein